MQMPKTSTHIRVLVRDGDDLIDRFEFDAQTIRIGSSDECEIHIRDRRLLELQATLHQSDDGVWTLDSAESENNTVQVNGRPVHDRVVIHHHDEIMIFNYTLAVYNDATKPSLISKQRAAETVAPVSNGPKLLPMPDGGITCKPGGDLSLSGQTSLHLATFCSGLYRCVDVPAVLDHLVDSLLLMFGCRCAYVGARRQDAGELEFVRGQLRGGRSIDESPLQPLILNRCLDNCQYLLMPRSPKEAIGSAMAAPLSNTLGELGVVYLDHASDAPPFSMDDLHELMLLANLAAAHIETLLQTQASVQSAAREGQLSFLREVQTRLDPARIPEFSGLQMAAYCKPGSQRGGDVFDVMKLANGLGGIFIGNVESDPTRTAMAMTEARTAFRSACMHADAPNVLLRSLNWMLCEDPSPSALHNACVLINPKSGQMQFSTAGKIGAVIIDQVGESRDLVNHDAPALGTTPGFAYMSGTECLKKDETLAVFSYGCATIQNEDGQALGEDALMESLRDGFGQSARIALDELIQDQAAFFKRGRQADDVSILLFHKTVATD